MKTQCMLPLTACVSLYIYPINKCPNAYTAGWLLGRWKVRKMTTSPTLGDTRTDDVSKGGSAVPGDSMEDGTEGERWRGETEAL